jgi:hypothetical protein
VCEASGGQDHSQPVVGGVAEAAGDPSVEFDDAVDGCGAAVAGPVGGEVGRNWSFQARRVRPSLVHSVQAVGARFRLRRLRSTRMTGRQPGAILAMKPNTVLT